MCCFLHKNSHFFAPWGLFLASEWRWRRPCKDAYKCIKKATAGRERTYSTRGGGGGLFSAGCYHMYIGYVHVTFCARAEGGGPNLKFFFFFFCCCNSFCVSRRGGFTSQLGGGWEGEPIGGIGNSRYLRRTPKQKTTEWPRFGKGSKLWDLIRAFSGWWCEKPDPIWFGKRAGHWFGKCIYDSFMLPPANKRTAAPRNNDDIFVTFVLCTFGSFDERTLNNFRKCICLSNTVTVIIIIIGNLRHLSSEPLINFFIHPCPHASISLFLKTHDPDSFFPTPIKTFPS